MTEPGRPSGDGADLTQIEVEFAPLLAQIGRIMTSSEDIDEVYDRFTEAVTSVIPADRLSIVVVDSEAWQHKSRYYAGIDVPLGHAGRLAFRWTAKSSRRWCGASSRRSWTREMSPRSWPSHRACRTA